MGLTAMATAGPQAEPQHTGLRPQEASARPGRLSSLSGWHPERAGGAWGLVGQTLLLRPPVQAAGLDPGPFSPKNIFQSLTWKQVS